MVSENPRSEGTKAPVVLAFGILAIAICSVVVAVVGFYDAEDDLVPAAEPIEHDGLPPGVVMPK